MADSKKNKASLVKKNVIESLKDLGSDFGAQGTDFLKSTGEEFFSELIGIKTPTQNRSGELKAGESVEMNEIISGKEAENQKLRAQISLERNLSAEESRLSMEKMNELRIQLKAITEEIMKLAASTSKLATQTEVAMVEVPVNPGVYHVIFFEKVLEFLKSFRKKIDQASIWLESTNKRAQKKNYWSMYKKKGSSFLLAPDHFLQRSAG